MKYTFIGDIHGRVDAVKTALDMDGMKIFVGDFMDSFKRSDEQIFECLDLVLKGIKEESVEAIYGNHELSYMYPKVHRCSGYRSSMMNEFYEEYHERIRDLFKVCIPLIPNILVTHAGLTQDLYPEIENSNIIDIKIFLEKEFKNLRSPVHGIGRARGGKAKLGGIFWCDYNSEFLPIPNLVQIFGHTHHYTGKYIHDINKDINAETYNIDCLMDYNSTFKNKFLTLDL